MRITTIGLALAIALVSGWCVGRAQTPKPEFTLEIDAPVGKTTVKCIRGCVLQGGRDEGNAENLPVATYWFTCSGTSGRCRATTNGWTKPGR